MPDMNGRQLADALKAREPGLAILYVSGYTSALFGEFGILNDGEDFLQKPYSMRQLAERVREVLDRHGRDARMRVPQ